MSKHKPLVTIGLSTYNRSDSYLRYALDSAVSQTWPNLEIIVSDNCSSDNTEEVVNSYSDPKIKYFRQERNIGAPDNFNFCVNQARGKYFLLLHDDDVIDSDFIETCMQALNDNKETGIIRSGTRIVDSKGVIQSIKPNYMKGQSSSDFLLSWFSDKTTLYLCSTLFNTKRLKEIGGFVTPTFLFNDVSAMLKLADNYGRVDTSYVKASFRRHETNWGSGNKAEDWLTDSIYIYNLVKDMNLHEKDLIVRKAQYFFSRKCYSYVPSISSPIQRLFIYLTIYSKFSFRYSPFAYLYNAKIRPRLNFQKVKRKIFSFRYGTAKL
ncbi:MAG: glycosyltransferase family 2 protein [Balneolales bacterium]